MIYLGETPVFSTTLGEDQVDLEALEKALLSSSQDSEQNR